jgi:hypothetical protein
MDKEQGRREEGRGIFSENYIQAGWQEEGQISNIV